MLNHFSAATAQRTTFIPANMSEIITVIQTGLSLQGGFVPSEQHVQSISQKKKAQHVNLGHTVAPGRKN